MEPDSTWDVRTFESQRVRTIVAIAVVHGLVHAFSIFLSPLNDDIRRYFLADSVSAVTALKSTYLATYAASNLLFGMVTNRISARKTLAVGLGVNALAIAAFALVPPTGMVWMHALWLLAAVGGGVYHPVANVLITRLYPEGKGRVLGFTGMGAAVGFALTPLMTTGLSSVFGFDWQDVALTFGLFGIAASVWVYHVVRDAEAELGTLADESEGEGRSGFGALTGIAGVLTAIILIMATREIAMWSVLDISDFFFVEVFGQTGQTGVYLFLLYAPGIVIQPLAGGLSDVFGRRWLTTVSFVIYGVSVGLVGVVPAGWIFLTYLGMGVGQAASIPTIEAFVADVAGPRLRGAAYGVFFTAGIALAAAGPGGSGALIDLFGGGLDAFRLVFAVLGGFVIVAACFIPRVIPPRDAAR